MTTHVIRSLRINTCGDVVIVRIEQPTEMIDIDPKDLNSFERFNASCFDLLGIEFEHVGQERWRVMVQEGRSNPVV